VHQCHGIPDNRPLCDGDIINVDITVYLNRYHGDCSRTFLIGTVDERGQYLVHHNEQALAEAIKVCRPGQTFNEIGSAISEYAAKVDLTTVPAFIGHGIGSFFHGPPEIYHYENAVDVGIMEPRMTFTIEPIFSLGSADLELWEDGWTAATADGARTSQFEHTVLITENGCEILTLPDP
jgi:methionyl aminopeptidase